MAVTEAVLLAEYGAALGGADDLLSRGDHIEIDGQFFDHYDIESLDAALEGCLTAADNTEAEVGDDAKLILGVTSLAALALRAAFSELPSRAGAKLPELAEAAVDWAAFARSDVASSILDDYTRLLKHASVEPWNDETPVPQSVFGELWPNGTPAGWPPLTLSFRPRARIIRTIGDRLISGPEAAVIELIKNSHDADASFVKVTFVPPLQPNGGMIIVEDDGHGMTIADLEQKWMEPATSDKRDRKLSPGGRSLLGSKGIGRFATSRLGRYLELVTSAIVDGRQNSGAREPSAPVMQTTRIPRIDWNEFDSATYLEEVRFAVESLQPAAHAGTVIKVSALREAWTERMLRRLYEELRRLISPLQRPDASTFRIFLDLSQCTPASCGFNGEEIVAGSTSEGGARHEVQPFPLLDACDYLVDGVFDEAGTFEGTMEIRRAGLEPERVLLPVPMQPDSGEEPCGIVLVRFHIFDREPTAIRSTAQKAGFGSVTVREARKLLDSIAGVAIYREGFRVRPYGDGENDWLTLDAKRVQNPTIKIGRNQISGIVGIDNEASSSLIERSSREGLEENGSYRRLQSLILSLLSEVVEPRRRAFRLKAGIEERQPASFQDIYHGVQLGWSKLLLAKLPDADRAAAQALVTQESDRLTSYLKRLEERQAQLEAQVTLGLIVGEVMHQGNTPLSFLETETARLTRWWPHLLTESTEFEDDRAEVPRILNGMGASSGKLRSLFNALSPLSGARRGNPLAFDPVNVIAETQYLFQSRIQKLGVAFSLLVEGEAVSVVGYPDDLATAGTNLIDNALYWLEYHAIPKPAINVVLTREGNRCVITIADNGTGIPAEFAEQVFDVGFTLKPNGTGLGLSIAKEAISRSSGDLQLLSSTSGAVFQISLPAETADKPRTVGAN